MNIVRPEDNPRLFWAMALRNRVARLVRLIELRAPELIIENERRLVAKALVIVAKAPDKLPVDQEAKGLADAEEKREALIKDHRRLRIWSRER